MGSIDTFAVYMQCDPETSKSLRVYQQIKVFSFDVDNKMCSLKSAERDISAKKNLPNLSKCSRIFRIVL